MAIPPIASVSASLPGLTPVSSLANTAPAAPGNTGFGDLLARGLDGVDLKVAKADALMKAYALGQPVPVHQVTIALEEARIAVELAVQVRERLTESYRSFMNMQL